MSSIRDTLESKLTRFEELERQMNDPAVQADGSKMSVVAREHGSLAKLATKYRRFKALVEEVSALKEMAEKGMLPEPGAEGRFNVPAVEKHLESKDRAEITEALKFLTDRYYTSVERYGGAGRDLVQLSVRLGTDPNGYSHFFTLDHIHAQAIAALAKGDAASLAELRTALARLEVGMIESGRVDIAEWGKSIGQAQVDPKSEVYKWIVESGVFPKDFFYHAFLKAPEPPKKVDAPPAPAPVAPPPKKPISVVVAVGENFVIGGNGKMPWDIKSELEGFKEDTIGGTLIMGRKTFESIGRLLPGRTMIVVTRQASYDAGGAKVASSIEEAIELANDAEEAFVIGGEELFRYALPLAKRFYQTVVHARPEGDTFFPEWDPSHWRLVEEEHHPTDEKNSAACTFRIWERAG